MVDKADVFPRLRIAQLALSLLFTASGILFLRFFCPWIFSTEKLQTLAFSGFFSLFTAFACVLFGGWIARKSKALQAQTP